MFISKLFIRFFFEVELWNIIFSLYIKGHLANIFMFPEDLCCQNKYQDFFP